MLRAAGTPQDLPPSAILLQGQEEERLRDAQQAAQVREGRPGGSDALPCPAARCASAGPHRAPLQAPQDPLQEGTTQGGRAKVRAKDS